jgi:hypothetical protein
MADNFNIKRTRAKDSQRAQAEAARQGRRHGRHDFPRPPLPGAPVDDHFAAARWAEAETAATLAVAEHLTRRRPTDDTTVARTAGAVLRRIAETADARRACNEVLHLLAALDTRVTLARCEKPWPAWLRLGLIGLMVAGSVANLAAGLIGATSDDPGYALGYSIAIGIGLVGLGAAAGQMLKRWELNRLRPHEHVAARSRVPAAVVALALVAALALSVAVASIRSTAAELDARRLAESGSAAVRVIAGDDPDGASKDAARPKPTIPALTWGLLEAVLVTGALLIEYTGSMPWARARGNLQRQVHRRRRTWLTCRRKLAHAWIGLRAACDSRAAHDAAVHVAGEATLLHTDVETGTYRYENLSHRPRPELVEGPVPGRPGGFAKGDETVRFTPEQAASTPITDVVVDRWGLDLRPLLAEGPTPGWDGREMPPDGGGGAPPGDLHALLALAQAELQKAIIRPAVDLVTGELDRPCRTEPSGPNHEPGGGAADTPGKPTELRPQDGSTPNGRPPPWPLAASGEDDEPNLDTGTDASWTNGENGNGRHLPGASS